MPVETVRDAERAAANKLVFAALELHRQLRAEHYTPDDVERLHDALVAFTQTATTYEAALDGWMAELAAPPV